MTAPQSLTIDSTMLRFDDSSHIEPASDIVYTLSALPQDGTLTVNGTALTSNGQFTQDQIDQGLVVYVHSGSSVVSDSFDFSVTDSAFQDNLGTGTFDIEQQGADALREARTLSGGTDPAIIFSGPGTNSFTGGTDTTVSYALATSGLTIVLSGSSPSINGFGGSDALVNIHNVIGSSHDDVFFPDSATDLIVGGGGNDIISGTSGDNITAEYGGARSDYFIAGSASVVQITDLRTGSPDGTDTDYNVQSFKFSDGTYSFAQLGAVEELDQSGATDLGILGNDYFLYAHGTGTGPELKYQGSAATVDGFMGWFAIGAEQVAGGGYDVAWHNSNGTYTVWNVDSNGNYVSNVVGVVTATDPGLEALETTFSQDLNHDGTIGIPGSSVIEASGATKLVQVGNDYFFYPVAGGSGSELTYGGAPYVAAAWTPVAAEHTSTGYEVALFNASSDLYTVWNTDSSGNVLSTSLAGASGTSTALEAIETSFQQDLNGDGTIGIPGAGETTIEAHGATALVHVGNDYFFNPVPGGTGPELTYGGTPFVAAAWAPVGAEHTSTGYEVALFNASSDLYTVWNTDSSGNVLSTSLTSVSGTSAALESIETSFQQDLNGDGSIGVPGSSGTTIEAFGATELIELGNDYFFNPAVGGTGPELKYSGTPFVAGAWTPIGAEHTSTGYEVALFNASSDLYAVWNTDSSGNVLSTSLAGVSGTNAGLESIETSFQQDLNGDSVIGPASQSSAATVSSPTAATPATIAAPSTGNAVLSGSAAGDTFVFNAQFGNDAVKGFQPSVDQVALDHTLVASVTDLFSHTADNAAGSAVVTISPVQSITFDEVSKAVLLQHASDFHLV